MSFLQGVARVWKWVRQPAPPRVPGPHVLPAYVAMGRYVAGTAQLEPRLRLLVTQLAAERAECGWCIEQGRHLWRQAFLAPELLRALPTYVRARSSPRRSAPRWRSRTR